MSLSRCVGSATRRVRTVAVCTGAAGRLAIGWRLLAAIVAALRCVSHVFREDSLELKRRYLIEHRADLLVMGDDWRGRFDEFADICQVRYLERTPNISTTLVKAEVFHKETHARRGA